MRNTGQAKFPYDDAKLKLNHTFVLYYNEETSCCRVNFVWKAFPIKDMFIF